MMFKKKTALNVRPEPPSFAEMTEDINSADSNDIIFTQSNNGTIFSRNCLFTKGVKPATLLKCLFCVCPVASLKQIEQQIFPDFQR